MSSIAITLTEEINYLRLYKLMNCKDFDIEEKNKIQKLYSKVIKNNGINTVDYTIKNRLIGKFPCIQNFKNTVKGYLFHDQDIADLDMKACAINIIWNITEKFPIRFSLEQREFAKDLFLNRDTYLENIGGNKKDAKETLCKWIFGSSKIKELTDQQNEIMNAIKNTIANMDELKYIKCNAKKDYYNWTGVRVSSIVYYFETQIILCAIAFFKEKRIKIESLTFDGLHIRGEANEELIGELEDYINNNLLFKTKWVVKEFVKPDLDFNDNELISDTNKEGIDKIIFDKFYEWTKQNNLLRLKSKSITLRKVNPYYGEQLYKNADETINGFIADTKSQNLFSDCNVSKHRNMIKNIIETNQPDDRFPVVETNWKYFGYSNGLFDIVSNKFITENFEEGILCRKYFDEPFEPLTSTPTILNKIYKDQNWDDETINTIFVLLGRAFFKINTLDNWGVIPCLVGTSSTGKSTSIERVMKNNEYVETLDSNSSSFNLEGTDKADLLVVEEAENIDDRLKIDQFKGIARGEKVKINGKNKMAITVEWNTPIILSANDTLKYKDKSGAIANRVVYFKFQTIIDKKDYKIKAQLEKDDPKILPYLIGKYHEYLSKNTEVLVLGDQIQSWNESLNNEDDDFYNWINGVSDDLYWCIKYEEGNSVSINEFKDKWKKHWTMGLKKKSEAPNIGIHEVALLGKLGINKKEINVCRYCENRHLKGCCEKYERTHRKKRVVFTNCAFEAGKLNRRDYQPKNWSENENTCEVEEEEV